MSLYLCQVGWGFDPQLRFYFCFFLWRFDPIPGYSLSLRGFVITLGHTTLGRIPPYEWSSQLGEHYLTPTHNTQISNPQFQQTSGRRPAASGSGISGLEMLKYAELSLWVWSRLVHGAVNASSPCSNSVRCTYSVYTAGFPLVLLRTQEIKYCH